MFFEQFAFLSVENRINACFTCAYNPQRNQAKVLVVYKIKNELYLAKMLYLLTNQKISI